MIESLTAARLGKLTHEQLTSAFAFFELGDVTEVRPVPFSNWGQTIFVTTTAGAFVLRGAPASPDQFDREHYFIGKLAESTAVPVPWPYLLNPSPNIFGWPYVIMPRLPGAQIGDDAVRQRLSPSDRRDLAEAMGRTLARMHGLTWPHAGTYEASSRTIVPFAERYGAHIAAKTRALLHDFQRYVRAQETADGIITDADLEWAEEILAQALPACAAPFVPTLVMGDYHERNVVADKVNGRWAVQGVFDFPTAHVGDGEADLSRPFATYHEQDPALAHAFLASYHGEHPPRAGFSERFALYMLADRAQIWAFGYSQKLVWWDHRLSFREWVSAFLAA